MNKYKELLIHFGKAPENEIDPEQAAKLAEMGLRDEQPKAAELKQILDECAYAALASDFAMMAMDCLWRMLLKDEAKNE